jgi:hypothetical protein
MIERYWINSPASFQPYYHLHGRKVLCDPSKPEYDDHRVRIYFTEGDTISQLINPQFLSAGWNQSPTSKADGILILEHRYRPFVGTPDENWLNNDIQFPRLISELEQVGAFTDAVVSELESSMDLDKSQICQLIDRAQSVWDDIVRRTVNPCLRPSGDAQ